MMWLIVDHLSTSSGEYMPSMQGLEKYMKKSNRSAQLQSSQIASCNSLASPDGGAKELQIKSIL